MAQRARDVVGRTESSGRAGSVASGRPAPRRVASFAPFRERDQGKARWHRPQNRQSLRIFGFVCFFFRCGSPGIDRRAGRVGFVRHAARAELASFVAPRGPSWLRSSRRAGSRIAIRCHSGRWLRLTRFEIARKKPPGRSARDDQCIVQSLDTCLPRGEKTQPIIRVSPDCCCHGRYLAGLASSYFNARKLEAACHAMSSRARSLALSFDRIAKERYPGLDVASLQFVRPFAPKMGADVTMVWDGWGDICIDRICRLLAGHRRGFGSGRK